MNTVAHYWKAIVAFIAPGAVLIAAAVTPGSDGGSTVTTAEIVTALVACVVTSAGVAAKGNAKATPTGEADHEEPLTDKAPWLS